MKYNLFKISFFKKLSIKKILRFFLNKFLKKIALKYNLNILINELSDEEYNFYKINNLTNSILKQNKLEEILNLENYKFLKVYILDKLYNLMLYNSDRRAFEYMQLYHYEKKEWEEKFSLSKINFSYLREQLFTGSLGNYASCFEYLESIKFGLNENKKLIFQKSKVNKITNEALFEYFKDFIEYIDNNDIYNKTRFSYELPIALPLGHSLEIGKIETFQGPGYNFVLQEKHKKKLKQNMLFKLKDKHIRHGYNKLKKLGIGKNDWWVTIHCRSGNTKGDWNTEYWRNSNISKFNKAINFINSIGGYVFRMGDNSMPKINETKKIIDYANSDIKDSIMDVFLGATSKFHLGTSSGYPIIPRFFGVPLLLCETTQTLSYWSLNDYDVFLPRLYKNTQTNQFVKFSDTFKPPYSIMWFDVKEKLKKMNLEIVENTDEDILEAAVLLNNIVDNNFTNEDSEIQKNFKNSLKKVHLDYNIPELIPYGNIPNSFLKKYSNLLK